MIITASITAFIVGILSHYFGISLSVAQIAGVAVAVKVTMIGTAMGIAWWLQRRPKPAGAVPPPPEKPES